MIDAISFLVLTFAVFRITRFVLFDTIIDGTRNKWYNFLLRGYRFKFLKNKAMELTSCSWCFSVHVSYTVYSFYTRTWPWELGVRGWLTVVGIAGAAGLLHAYEPGD